MPSSKRLQIIISAGPDDPRATLGFATAAAAGACGLSVIVFLVMNGARWALKSIGNEPQQPGQQPVAELLETIQACDGTVEVCSNCLANACSGCSHTVCSATPDGARPSEMRDGIRPGGLATIAVRMTEMPTVTF